MIKKSYLNTSYINQSFTTKVSTFSVRQQTILSDKIITIKQFTNYKKIKSHSEVAKLMRGFGLQKKSNIFNNQNNYRREKFVSTGNGQYGIVKSIIM